MSFELGSKFIIYFFKSIKLISQHYVLGSKIISDNFRLRFGFFLKVDVKFRQKFDSVLSLSALREVSALEDMVLLRKGSRLSIQPVSEAQWNCILQLAGKTV